MECKAILISGFTAAGKTTHARLIARHLDWSYLGSSEIRRQILAKGSGPWGREWTPGLDARRRLSPDGDRCLDTIIGQALSTARRPLVVDAWLQPWLYPSSDALRVWLGSDPPSRVRKAIVSFLRDGLRPPCDTETQVSQKDSFSVEIFRRIYGVEFGPDPGIFDVIVDNSSYISEASIVSSDDGISRFHPILTRKIVSALW